MKKIILLSVVGALGAFGASAQYANSAVNVKAVRGVEASIPTVTLPKTGTTMKTTAAGFRRYDHQEYAASISTTTFQGSSVPIWQDSSIRVNYTGGLGSINFSSVSQVFYPFDNLWNDAANPNFLGQIAVTATNSYQVDSVRLDAFYLLGNLTTTGMSTQVDTLEISVASQPAGNAYYWRGSVSSWALPYLPSGRDTLWASTAINVDSIRKSVNSNPIGARQTWKVPLTPSMRVAAASATTFQEFSYKVPTPLAVPAGNVVLVSYTFRTGGAWNKNSDTVTQRHNFRPGFAYPGTTTMSEAPKYTWYSGDHSMSSLMFSTDTNFYAPQLVIGATNTATSWFYQYLLNSITVSCTSCDVVKVDTGGSINESSLIAKVKAFPNPANTELSVPFTVNEKSTVTVSLTNMIGQVVATQSVNANAGQEATATFNTSNLAAGVYLYTVEANGQRVSNRVSVAH